MIKKATKKNPAVKAKPRPVLVTTAHRGVFFGYLVGKPGKDCQLRAARNVVYWSEDVRGFLGLAANGPTPGCRIGPAANVDLRDLTCIAEVAPAAARAFEAAPWA